MLITSSQIQWTADCEKALGRGDKKGLKSLKKKQVLFAINCTCRVLYGSFVECNVGQIF